MKKTLIAILLAAASLSALADDGWTTVASSNSGRTFEMQGGSLKVMQDHSGDELITVVGKITNKDKNTVNLERWAVLPEDCESGYGIVRSYDMGNKLLYSADFVLGGRSNVASRIAAILCVKVPGSSI